MSIEKVTIKNFTVFNDLEIKFSKGVNIIIGENGTGKTQLIKLIYAISHFSKGNNNIGFLLRYFKTVNSFLQYVTDENKNLFLGLKVLNSNNITGSGISTISKEFLENNHYRSFENCKNVNGMIEYKISFPITQPKCVFIPAKDMLTHSRGLVQMADKFNEFPFDKTLIDIVKIAGEWTLKEVPKIAKNILPIIEDMIEGTVIVQNEEFYVKKNNGELVNFSFEAEGLKKLALLWQLLMNDNIKEDSVLLWDEPEANINPKFIPGLVEILFELQRNGVQVFVTTHDYMFAKYFGVKCKKEDNMMYYSLYKTEDGVKCEDNTSFTNLENNSIMETFIQLYKDEVERDMQ